VTGTGTFTDPIIAMSGVGGQIATDVRASLAHFNRNDDPYWIEKESTPAQFSNGLWFLGHNRYWEARMDPANTGSADPNLGTLPALYLATGAGVPPIVLPDPPSAPPDDTAAGVLKLVLARLDSLDARMTLLLQTKPPVYTGTIKVPYLGSGTVTLTPTPKP